MIGRMPKLSFKFYMQKTKVIIRVNGGASIGMGHIYRGIALGEILKEEFEITFLLDGNSFEQPIINAKFNIEVIEPDVPTFTEPIWIRDNYAKDCLIVLDGYHFDQDYQSSLVSFWV